MRATDNIILYVVFILRFDRNELFLTGNHILPERRRGGFLEFIEVLPSFAGRETTSKEGIGEGVVSELLGAWVEEKLSVQALGNDTKAKDL